MASKPIKKSPVDEVKKEDVVDSETPVAPIEIDANRQSILNIFADMGIEPDATKSTTELTADLQKHVLKMHSSHIAKQVSLANADLNSVKGKTNLSNDEFILRLLNLGIPKRYLLSHRVGQSQVYIFTDTDKGLSDKKIWEKVRFSNFNPTSSNELFTRKLKRPSWVKTAQE